MDFPWGRYLVWRVPFYFPYGTLLCSTPSWQRSVAMCGMENKIKGRRVPDAVLRLLHRRPYSSFWSVCVFSKRGMVAHSGNRCRQTHSMRYVYRDAVCLCTVVCAVSTHAWDIAVRCGRIGRFSANYYNKLCGRPPQYTPAPCKLTFWPFDLESGVRVQRRRKEVWDRGKTTGGLGTGVPQRGPGAEPQ